jgi:DNA-binding MarR family transcriptional regulator
MATSALATWSAPLAPATSSCADREILLLTNRLKKALWRTLESELEREGLSVPQWLVLSGLARKEGGTLTQFSRLLGYDAGSLSRVIHQLTLRKLIVTDRASQDRRNALLELSDAGFDLYRTIESRVSRLPPLVATALGDRRITVLAGLMERAIGLLEDASATSKAEGLSS